LGISYKLHVMGFSWERSGGFGDKVYVMGISRSKGGSGSIGYKLYVTKEGFYNL
jgi:hypothetical protein